MKNKVIDLFAGVGGLSLGFKKAGFNVVLANEIDSSIAKSYSVNHPDTKMINEDITKLDIKNVFVDFQDTCVVVGGPPCQGFSQKGSRLIDDDRNFLFMYFYEVVKFIRPKYFVIENVPNILTSNSGSFKKEIYSLFEGIGYSINSKVVDASDYGVPQTRKRALIIGKHGDSVVCFPDPSQDKVTAWDAISDLAYLQSGEGTDVSTYVISPKTKYQKHVRAKSKTLFNHKATNHSSIAIQRMKMIPENGGREHLPKEHLTKSIYSGTWGRMVKDEPCVTITTRFDTPSSGRFTHPTLSRAITVREAARLQGFPDCIEFVGTKTSQMKQVGNAVPPILAYEIAKTIRKDLDNE